MPESNQRPHQPPPNQLPPQQQQQLQQQPPMQQRLQQQQPPPQQIAPQNPLQPNLQMPPPPPQIPQDFISFFQVMMTNQSALMERLSENIFNMKKERSTAEYTMEVLAKNIQDFHYDEENGVTFAQWFERFATTFKENARALTEDAKVRLLLRKWGASEYSRYVNLILPNTPASFDFSTTIEKLSKIFGQSESIFNTRFHCLQTTKSSCEDYTAYTSRVNKSCEQFQLGKLTSEQFKCLIFVKGLHASCDSDVRTRLLALLQSGDETKITLSNLLLECQRIATLKQDSQLLETAPLKANAVSYGRKKQPNNNALPISHPASGSSTSIKTLPRTPCWGCGGMHFAADCSFKNHQCPSCKRTGHKEGYCSCFAKANTNQQSSRPKGKSNKRQRKSNVVAVNTLQKANRKFIEVHINGLALNLQLDTGTDVTILSKNNWEQLGSPKLFLDNNSESVIDAQGRIITMLGSFIADVKLDDKTSKLSCRVADLPNLNLFGINWIDEFRLWDQPFSNISKILRLTSTSTISVDVHIQKIKKEFADIFTEALGHCTKFRPKLYLRENATPIYRAKRPVPYAALQQVEEEFNRLERLGVITPIDFSEWAAPIVAVRKANGNVRICPDYSTGLNDALQPHQHPLPLPEEIFVKHADGKFFTHIDLSDAYLQVEVEEESKQFLTINTHRGLYKFNRLPPGVKAAPGSFQQVMDTMLCQLEGVSAFIDDLLVSGKTVEEHIQRLKAVLTRLREYGFHIKIEKCSFFQTSLKYLGHVITSTGLKPDPDKSAAIVSMPPPQNLSQLRSFLRAINYYGKFIPDISKLSGPLHALLKKDSKWVWTKACQDAFTNFKNILSSDLGLAHYDPQLPIIVAADASNMGIGACISHRFEDGTIKPVYHASRTLTSTEQNYSQVEKEGLALTFAVKKFHRMLLGRHFTLQTDHKPLLSIFGSKKGVPVYTANRLQRWAITLLRYDFSIQFISTSDFGNADILSRLISQHPRPNSEEYVIATTTVEEEACADLKHTIQLLPLTFDMVQKATLNNSELNRIANFIKSKWPNKNNLSSTELQYFNRREALTPVNNCIMFGDRLVIPECYRTKILRQVHRGHPGIQNMKAIARGYIYWPQIDKDIENFVKECSSCQSAAKSPIKTTLQSWPLATEPWQRIHIDYAGPIQNVYYLVVIDAHSKWPEIIETSSSTSTATINILREIFSRHGYPKTLVSDNGTQFCSHQFKNFCESAGILHMKTAPFHPQSNGQAERFVDTLKRSLQKLKGEVTMQEALQQFLFMYRTTPNRNTPNSTSPAEAMYNRKIRTSLDLLIQPKLNQPVINEKQNLSFNRQYGAKHRSFAVGDAVFVKLYRSNKSRWIPGEILERVGAVNYNVRVNTRDRLVRSHTNQIRPRSSTQTSSTPTAQIPLSTLLQDFNMKPITELQSPEIAASQSSQPVAVASEECPQHSRRLDWELGDNNPSGSDQREAIITPPSIQRRSNRKRRATKRYSPPSPPAKRGGVTTLRVRHP
ncbi:uncharacterized protein K02A2.6-like [Eupeodes corollae]|uniref:uncharacterized protein K02A2.6-like n=1 Tax=Eupeodes corollae TaxID=290404 RepID=UPI00248FF37C|nr:uncharacterized protein K02A2.6-like [Eupeodes corollae]